ncbi:cytochrome ubiquinol oxidase subunit I [Planctomycetota bacterium]
MDLDPVFLSRLQFALTICFHYIFPQLTIGLAWVIVWMTTRYVQTGDEAFRRMSRFWIKVFALSFAVGVATGITMEFQFGTNWANYSKFVGDVFGAPLAAEGIFAFFLESSFLGILLFGEQRVSKRVYWLSSVLVAVGSTLSAFWIIVANSWQQTPAGYEIVGGRAQLVDFWAAVFNPSMIPGFLHTIGGALVTGTLFVVGLSAWYLLRKQHVEFAKRSLIIGLVGGFVFAVATVPLGHLQAVQVAKNQPEKLAAFEGHWETTTHAPLLLVGIPNAEEERTDFAIHLPNLLSIGVGGSADTEVMGLKDVPRDERPPLIISFFSFHLMVGLGMYFIGLTGWGLLLWLLGRLYDSRLFLKIALLSIPLPFIANELGWIAAEVGRQPWAVYKLMRTADGISPTVPAAQILFSIIMFSVIYALLFCLWIFALRRKLLKGPEDFSTPDANEGSAASQEVLS